MRLWVVVCVAWAASGCARANPAFEAMGGSGGADQGDDAATSASSSLPNPTSTSTSTSGAASGTTAKPTTTEDPTTSGTLGGSTGPPIGDAAQVVYLNFEGAQVIFDPVTDDAADNRSSIPGVAADYGPFANDAASAVLLAHLEAMWADFDVALVTERPALPGYTMVLITEDAPPAAHSTALGLAVLDCGNQNPNNLAFAFLNPIEPVEFHAWVVGHNLAATFGLEAVVSTPGEVMSVEFGLGATSFTDQCRELDDTALCGPQHVAECGDGQQQNSAAELRTLFPVP